MACGLHSRREVAALELNTPASYHLYIIIGTTVCAKCIIIIITFTFVSCVMLLYTGMGLGLCSGTLTIISVPN